MMPELSIYGLFSVDSPLLVAVTDTIPWSSQVADYPYSFADGQRRHNISGHFDSIRSADRCESTQASVKCNHISRCTLNDNQCIHNSGVALGWKWINNFFNFLLLIRCVTSKGLTFSKDICTFICSSSYKTKQIDVKYYDCLLLVIVVSFKSGRSQSIHMPMHYA